jgi:hypothetical protein
MSTLLEQASLVLIPSGYKEDIVYSVIPSNGSGDMSFTRASDGTRINSAGLVENTPWNLFQQSETFENASWTKNNISVATGIGTTPEGLPYRILTNTVNGFNSLAQTPPLVIGNFYSVTIVLKKGTAISVGFRVGAGTWGDAKYNFDTDTFVGSAVALASRRFLGDGWIEIKYQNFEALQTNFRVFVSSSTTGNSLDGLIGQTLLISRMQVNIGSTAKPYFPTTDRLNVPRLTYQNGGGGCPSLLLEPQRTNVLTYSEDFTIWTKGQFLASLPTVTADYGISPSGVQNADRVQMTRPSGASYVEITKQSFITIGTVITFSVFIKSLIGATKMTIGGTGSSNTINLTNDWVRYTYTMTTTNNPTTFTIAINGSAADSLTADFLVWGAQVEAGAYQSSYIPTVAASATRIADVCSKTGISSLIGQTEGTLFYDIDLKSRVSYNYIAINDGTATNYIGIYITPTNLQLETYVASTLQTAIVFTNSSIGRFKIAAGYKNNDFVLYVNGTLIGTDTSGSVPTCNKLDLTAFNQANSIGFNSVQLYKTKLTNSQLVTLTTI